MGIDSYMIPITIVICLVALAPFVAPDLNLLQEERELPKPKIIPSHEKSEQYFKSLENNIEDTKDTIRDLMAEHEANNP